MSQQVVPRFLDNLLGYYGAPAAHYGPHLPPAVVQQHAPAFNPGPVGYMAPSVVPMFVGGGGSGSGHHVQVVASNPETIRELRQNEQEDRQNSQGTMAAVLGGIATIAFAGVAAFVARNLMNADKELNQAIAFRDDQLTQLDPAAQADLEPIVDKHVELLESKLFWSKSIVVLTGGALACAIAAFVGGMFVIPWLMTAAVIGAVILAAGGVFAGVWYCTDDTSMPHEMLTQIQTLRAQYA